MGVTRPIICLDFDGVCHKHMQEWVNIATVADGPTDGLGDWIAGASRRARITLFSSRFHEGRGRQAISEWWDLWKLPPIEMWMHKPPALVSIDDRALTFTGNWDDFPIEKVLEFKPWNRQPPGPWNRQR